MKKKKSSALIISASRRTDIPAFYTKWFKEQVTQGYTIWKNPFRPSSQKKVFLNPKEVDCFVFWTKCPSSDFLDYLKVLDSQGFFYYFHFTLNDMPELEPHLPDLRKRIEIFQQLSLQIGKNRVIWRYDPLLFNSTYSMNYHIEKLLFLFEQIKDNTEKLILSFFEPYEKAIRRIRKNQQDFFLPLEKEKKDFLLRVKKALGEKIPIHICAQETYGIFPPSACIDGFFIEKITGKTIFYTKDKNQRKNCRCVSSIDIGTYRTCRFGCLYCYAIS